MADVVEVNALTGQAVERSFTPTEVTLRDAALASHLAQESTTQVVKTNRTILSDRAAAALQGNREFVAIASPTNAQAVAQVRALTQQNTAVIRLLLNLLDGTD